MSEGDPPGDNPFESMGFLGDLARMLRSQGPVSWDAARQFAQHVATEGASESNPDPMERVRLERLSRVADLQVSEATGLATSTTGAVVQVVPVTRGEWARRTLDAYRPFLERVSSSLSTAGAAEGRELAEHPGADPTARFLGDLFSMVGPMLLGMQSGSMVGHLAQRSLGQYDLPLPRPASDHLMVVDHNLRSFIDEWDLSPDDLGLWVCLSELSAHAVLGLAHVRSRLEGLVLEHTSAFEVNADALESSLADVDPTDPEGLQRALRDPGALLGAIQSSRQRELLPQLAALVAVVVGYVDHVVGTVGPKLMPSFGTITEALHRRRVARGEGDRFVEHLFGLELGREQYERGGAFVRGVLERAGEQGLARLWRSAKELPTPAEVDAPGLWLARIELPD